MKRIVAAFGMLLLIAGFQTSCRRTPDPQKPIGTTGSVAPENIEETLKLRPGLKIILTQNLPDRQAKVGGMIPGVRRQMEVQTPLTSEGLTFQWSLRFEPPSASGPESAPSAGNETVREDGSMSLANVVGARAMTLPIFWPQGELYLSNSSALWISDRALDDLKKTKKSEWNLGLLGNGLMGAVTGMENLQKPLEEFLAAVQRSPELAASLPQIELWDKSVKFPVKINGKDQELKALVAGNWLAEYTILDQAQNPLILQVRILPKSKVGSMLFSPLAWAKPYLEYRVQEIEAPVPVMRISPAF